ncbi:MAG: hypothetical protein K6E98_03835 [Lachnospiraceae bacterium]|nr:hypothetical protein [Lachnospiraceae bacterium]
MRTDKYLYVAEWLNNFMIVLLYYIVVEFFYAWAQVDITYWAFLLVAIIVTYSYLCRVYIHNLIIYVILQIVFAGGIILLPMDIVLKVTGVVVGGILFFCNLMFWKTEGVRSFISLNISGVIIPFLIFLQASFSGNFSLLKTAYISGVSYTSLFLIKSYLNNCIKFMSDVQNNKNVPLDDMFKYNGRIVFPFIISVTIGMFLIRVEGLADSLMKLIKNGFDFISQLMRRLIIFIISLLPSMEVSENAVSGETDYSNLVMSKPVPSWLIALLSAIEKVISVVTIMILVYIFLKALFEFVKKYFLRKGYDKVMIDYDDHVDINEKVRHKRKNKIIHFFEGGNENLQIRRIYKQKVEKMRKNGYRLEKFHTPSERLENIHEIKYENIPEGFDELTHNYESVRYSRTILNK